SLLTLQSNWRFTWTQPTAFIDDGIKPVYRVTTRLGRSIKTTLTHPFLTIKGWRSLGVLQTGDKIAVPRQVKVFGSEVISKIEVEAIAKSIIEFNCRLFEDEGEYLWQRRKDAEKVIPQLIFRLKSELVAWFLNRLFATDGWATVLASGQSQLGYATASEKLARQIQHLLLRFGIIAAVKHRLVKYQKQQRQIWQLDITDVKSIKTFIDDIGIFGKEGAISRVRTAIWKRRYQTNHDLIPIQVWEELAQAKGSKSWQSVAKEAGIKGHSNIYPDKRALSRERLFKLAYALENISLQNLATSEVYWDEIVSIEYVGKQQVYDLTIPQTHNFVANDMCVHNTAFSLCVASNIARDSKLPIAVFSLEMSREQLTQRLLSGEARIPSNRLRSGRIAQNEFGQLIDGVERLSELPIYIDDTANLTVMQMRSQVRRLQAQQKDPLGLVMIDYLQLMEGGDNDNRVQQLSKMTRSLKGLARELNVPIVALSQLSRGVEQRTNKRPMLSDLRESGSIEQDADLVMMIYRDEYYNPDTPDRGITEVSIVKHRNGPVGTVKLLFNAELTRFESLAKPGGY
ncbi:MAG: DnaB-like helicase C-terminal domain-containing protein, partial [Cyanobacteria bacterium P01_A01_bin.83]